MEIKNVVWNLMGRGLKIEAGPKGLSVCRFMKRDFGKEIELDYGPTIMATSPKIPPCLFDSIEDTLKMNWRFLYVIPPWVRGGSLEKWGLRGLMKRIRIGIVPGLSFAKTPVNMNWRYDLGPR